MTRATIPAASTTEIDWHAGTDEERALVTMWIALGLPMEFKHSMLSDRWCDMALDQREYHLNSAKNNTFSRGVKFRLKQ